MKKPFVLKKFTLVFISDLPSKIMSDELRQYLLDSYEEEYAFLRIGQLEGDRFILNDLITDTDDEKSKAEYEVLREQVIALFDYLISEGVSILHLEENPNDSE